MYSRDQVVDEHTHQFETSAAKITSGKTANPSVPTRKYIPPTLPQVCIVVNK